MVEIEGRLPVSTVNHVDALSNFHVQLLVPYHIYTKHGYTSSRHELRGD